MANFEKIEIGRVYMRVNRGKEIALSKLSVTYAINRISAATAVPALGKSLGKHSKEPDLSVLKEGARVHIYIGDERVFNGYISGISGSANAGLFKKTLSIVVYVKGIEASLSGSPAQSVIFSGKKKGDNIGLAQLGKSQWFSGDPVEGTTPMSTFVDNIIKKKFGLSPASIAKDIVDSLLEDWDNGRRSELFSLDNELAFDVEETAYVNALASIYMNAWYTNNAWAGLLNITKATYLSVVPTATLVFVGAPLALSRKEHITLTVDEYTSIEIRVQDDGVEPVDGIFILNPNAPNDAEDPITFPSRDGEVGEGKYYHQRSMPGWAYAIWQDQKTDISTLKNKSFLKGKPSRNTGKKHFLDLGTAIAKSEYAMAKMRRSSAAVTLPLRYDLMPGTIVKLEVTDDGELSFLGTEPQFGMIDSVTISADMLADKGKASTQISLVAMRNETDNNNDDFTFEEHPLYKGSWLPLDVGGLI